MGTGRRRFALASRAGIVLVVATVIVLGMVPAAIAAATFTNHRISGEAPNMGQANDGSNAPSISADGRYVAYASAASNILGGSLLFPDNGGFSDIFRYDRLTGQTVLVSRDNSTFAFSGHWPNGDSYNPSISADGRYVAFESYADDLVSDDDGGYCDIFVRDMVTGVTTRWSVAPNGDEATADSFNPSIAGNGTRVAFDSEASNIAGGDGNGIQDVFVKEIVSPYRVWRVKGRGGVEPNDWSGWPSLNYDGTAVAFASVADNLVPGDDEGWEDVFYFTVGYSYTSTPERCSESQYDGAGGDDDSANPAISADGSIVAYETWASNLDPDDNGLYRDVYVWEQGYDSNGRVSVSSSGDDADGASWYPSISADGMKVAFKTDASNLIATGDNGSYRDIYVRDMSAHTTTRASISYNGVNPNGDSDYGRISGNGMHVAFSSFAQNIEATDVNGNEDVFVRTQRAMISVYRFYNLKNGSHFYTPSETEKNNVIAKYPTIYKYEGVAYQVNSSLSWQPLYRFYNKKNGTHFYTASAAERDNTINNLSATYQYDGPTYAVSTRAGTGSSVWRFYNKKLGSHFYTASEAEKNNVVAHLSATFTLEGVAFYLPQ